jgi:hypothetical protein
MATNNINQNYGATYSTDKEDFGKITSIFMVDEDWDGYRYNGYCRPTEAEVYDFYADKK